MADGAEEDARSRSSHGHGDQAAVADVAELASQIRQLAQTMQNMMVQQAQLQQFVMQNMNAQQQAAQQSAFQQKGVQPQEGSQGPGNVARPPGLDQAESQQQQAGAGIPQGATPVRVQGPIPQPPPGDGRVPGYETPRRSPADHGFFSPEPQRQVATPPSQHGSLGVDGGRQSDSMSRADKWLQPLEKPKLWKNRSEEVVGWSLFVTTLSAWLGNLSDKYPREVQLSVKMMQPIRQETLSAAEATRSIRLYSLVCQLFAEHPKASGIISAYSEGTDVTNHCGYEVLRLLAQEYALRSRSEGLFFRNEFLGKAYNQPTVSELLTAFDTDVARYQRLINSLPQDQDREALRLNDADKSLVLLRSLPNRCRDHVIVFSTDDFQTIRRVAIEFERKHRIWETPLSHGKMKELLGDDAAEGAADGSLAALSTTETRTCYLCGKQGHLARECRQADAMAKREKFVCHNCGKEGHFSANCPQKKGKGKGKGDGKSSKGKGKGYGKAQKGKSKGKEKGSKGKKGKMNEYLDESWNESEWWSQSDSWTPNESDWWDNEWMHEQQGQYEPGESQDPTQSEETPVLSQVLCMPLVKESENVLDENMVQQFSGLRKTNYSMLWLLDSGASSHVISEQYLHLYEVLEERQAAATFSTAEGNSVCMNRIVRIALHFKVGKQAVRCELEVFVGKVQHNILSVGALVEKGWCFSMDSTGAELTLKQTSIAVVFLSGCPWIQSFRPRTAVRSRDSTGMRDVEMSDAYPSCKFFQWSSVPPSLGLNQMHFCNHHNCQIQPQHGLQPVNQQKPTSQSICNSLSVVREAHGFTTHGAALQHDHMSRHQPATSTTTHSCLKTVQPTKSVKQHVTFNLHPQEHVCPMDSEHVVSADECTLNAFKSDVPLEVHVQRGHYPFDPKCPECKACHSTSHSRRRAETPCDLQADFAYAFGQRILVLWHSQSGHLIGIVTKANLDQTRTQIRLFFESLGLTGHGDPLSIVTDKEDAVSKLIRGTDLGGRHVNYVKAQPQGHQAVGGAERSVRAVHEGLAKLNLQLRKGSLKISCSEDAVQTALNYVCLCHNVFNKPFGLHTPVEELQQRDLPVRASAVYMSHVLAELPDSVRDADGPRFEKAVYLHLPLGGKLGHMCMYKLPGMSDWKVFHAKSIKLLTPMTFEDRPTGLCDALPADAAPVSSDVVQPVEQTAVSEQATADFDMSSNPPFQWYQEHGKTDRCIACQKGVKGRVHSKACKERYRVWLETERNKLQGGAASGAGAVAASGSGSGDVVPASMPMVPDQDIGVPQEISQPSQPSRPVQPRSVSSSDVPMSSVGPVKRPRSASVSGSATMDIDMQEANVPANPHEDPGATAVEQGEEMDIVEDDEKMSMFYSLVHEIVPEPSFLSVATGTFRRNATYEGSATRKVKLCGAEVIVSVPTNCCDESGNHLDGVLATDGVCVEYTHMSTKDVGRPVKEPEAAALAKEWGIRIIGCRWVFKSKPPGVRSRCVVQDVAHQGAGSASSLGFSSPTASADAMRLALAMAAEYDMSILSGDVSAAFMASPLPRNVKAIVRMPPGTRFADDGSPVFMVLSKAMNGLRPASLAWTKHFSSLAKKNLNLSSNPVEPTCFVGYFHQKGMDDVQFSQQAKMMIVLYVDDILFLSNSQIRNRAALQILVNAGLELRETGDLGSSAEGGGQIEFLSRVLQREPGENTISVAYKTEYYKGIAEMKLAAGLKPIGSIPQIKQHLDAADEQSKRDLDDEMATQYRCLLGKIAWLAPFRPDLASAISMLSVGQAKPQLRHERGLKQLTRYVLATANARMVFPSPYVEECLPPDDTRAHHGLNVMTDASFAPMSALQRKSVTGTVAIWLNSVVSFSSRLQSTVSLSSAEAELTAIQEACCQAQSLMYLTGFLLSEDPAREDEDFSQQVPAANIFTDSRAACDALKRLDVQRKLRHADIRWCYVRRLIENEVIYVGWLSGSTNLADLFTKVLSGEHFISFRSRCGVLIYGPSIEMTIPSKAAKAKSSGGRSSGARSSSKAGSDSEWEEYFETSHEGSDEDPEDLMPVGDMHIASVIQESPPEWQITPDVNFLLIEICCFADSPLSAHFESMSACKAWRVLEEHDFRLISTVFKLEKCIVKARKVNSKVQIWLHFSLPCSGGSRLMQRKCIKEEDRQRGSMLRIAFRRMLASAKILLRSLRPDNQDQASFELSATCAYWKWRTVHRLRMTISPLTWFAACPKLCAMSEGQVSAGRPPLSKTWRIISTSPHVTTRLAQFEECRHESHTKPKYDATSRYPMSLIKALCQGIVAADSIVPDCDRMW